MNHKTQLAVIQAWRALAPTQQQAQRLLQIPLKVARSMAFEGEPVPPQWLSAQSQRLGLPTDSLKPPEVS